MRVVLDTNVLLAALISPGGSPARIYEAWKLGRVTRYPTIRPLITVSEAGRMINQIRALAILVEHPRSPKVSPDPADDFLFGIAESARADYIVTGDKSGVLKVRKHGRTRVLAMAQFVSLLD